MVTLVVSDLAEARRFYIDLMEMVERPVTPPGPDTCARQAELWGVPVDSSWSEVLLHRPRLPNSPRLRLVRFNVAHERIRPGMNALLEGRLSVGFALRDMPHVVARGVSLGFDTTAGIATLAMQRAAGSAYEALECHFRAPDEVYAVGVARPPDLAPVGPIELDRNVHGPCYSAQVASPVERVLDFYTQILDYEVRRDVVVSGPGPERGLGLPPGTQMRFLQVFSSRRGERLSRIPGLRHARGCEPSRLAPSESRCRRLDVCCEIDRRGACAHAAPRPRASNVMREVDVPGMGMRRVLAVERANGALVELVKQP
jgi:catechol 2,3-dioxygenase-like lactoylglutathione lyase family enzyme